MHELSRVERFKVSFRSIHFILFGIVRSERRSRFRFVKLSKVDIFFPLFSFSLFFFFFFSFSCQWKIDRSPLHSENWFTYIVYVGFMSYRFYFNSVFRELNGISNNAWPMLEYLLHLEMIYNNRCRSLRGGFDRLKFCIRCKNCLR